MKEEQEKVVLTGFKLTKYKAIKAVQFTPDVLSQKLIRVTGEIGSSKSSVLEGLQIATSGATIIDKKDDLDGEFCAEVQLLDGEQKLFLGAKIRETKKGEKKFETFIYSKGADGKPYTPIIDGSKATAKDYMEMLSTDITFRMSDLFSENQTTHRKIIEKIFHDELKGLGVDEIVESIDKAKKLQDTKRSLADARGCFMESFKKEGYTEDSLAALTPIDIPAIREQIKDAEIKKDRLINSPATAHKLATVEAQNIKDTNLNDIKEKATQIVEKVREINDSKTSAYSEQLSIFLEEVQFRVKLESNFKKLSHEVELSDWLSEEARLKITDVIESDVDANLTTRITVEEPLKPNTIPIEFGKMSIPAQYDEEYKPLIEEREKYLKEYDNVLKTPLNVPELTTPDTSDIDNEIERLNAQVKGAEYNNDLVSRFSTWGDWIAAKGMYQKELDTLRKLYAKIDTGVDGMKIVPKTTNSGRIEIWMMYDGSYDTDFFQNKEGEMRHITGKQAYSASQKGIIGLLLQSARLDKKPKALRLAIIDDVPLYTKAGVSILKKVQEDKDLMLITTHTDSEYDKEDIDDGVIIMEGGEAFFN